MAATAWNVEADTVTEILATDEYRDELVVQLHSQVGWPGGDFVYLGFGEDAVDGEGVCLGGIGHTVRVLGAKARLAVSAVCTAASSGGIETHTSLEYRHTPNYPIWQKQS